MISADAARLMKDVAHRTAKTIRATLITLDWTCQMPETPPHWIIVAHLLLTIKREFFPYHWRHL
jgi:hypothetical protein